MTSYFDQRQAPIHLGGMPLEVRVRELEIHRFYDDKRWEELREQIEEVQHELTEIEKDRAALARRLGLWVIGALATALATVMWNLVLRVLNGDFPLHG